MSLPQTGSPTLPGCAAFSLSLSLHPAVSLRAPSTVDSFYLLHVPLLPACNPLGTGLALPASLLCPQFPAHSPIPILRAMEVPAPALPAPVGTTASRPSATMPTACGRQTCCTTVCPCTTPQVRRGGSAGAGQGQGGGGRAGTGRGLGTTHQACPLQGTSWAWGSVSSMG